MNAQLHYPSEVTIACPTAGDVNQFSVALASYIQNAKAHGYSPRFLISDDSPKDDGIIDAKCEVSSYFSRTAGVAIEHVKNRKGFATRLRKESGVDQPVIDFCMFGDNRCDGVSYGANRNSILMMSETDQIIYFDDDTVCDISSLSPSECGLSACGHVDTMSIFSTDHTRQVPMHDIDLIGAFLSAFAFNFDVLEKVNVTGACCDHLFFSIGNPTPPNIAAVVTGAAGDCGMSTYLPILTAGSRESISAFALNDNVCRSVAEHRYLLRQMPKFTISHCGNIMAMCLGINRRVMLPPFFPLFRGEDALFGLILTSCLRDEYIANLPFMIKHNMKTGMCGYHDVETRVADVIMALVLLLVQDICVVSNEDRLIELGRRLHELARSSLKYFIEVAFSALKRMYCDRCNILVSTLDEHADSCVYWRCAILDRIATYDLALQRSSFPSLDEFATYSNSLGTSQLKTLVDRFGLLLMAWPHLLKSAKTIVKQ